MKKINVETIVENGHAHYKLTDEAGREVHCEFSELNETLREMEEC